MNKLTGFFAATLLVACSAQSSAPPDATDNSTKDGSTFDAQAETAAPDAAAEAAPPDAQTSNEQAVAALCKALCDQKVRCKSPSVTATCASDCTARATWTPQCRADYVTALATCTDNAGCSDNCIETPAQKGLPETPEMSDCLARHKECGGGFSDDYCYTLPVLGEDPRMAVRACFGQACSEIKTCLKGTAAFTDF